MRTLGYILLAAYAMAGAFNSGVVLACEKENDKNPAVIYFLLGLLWPLFLISGIGYRLAKGKRDGKQEATK